MSEPFIAEVKIFAGNFPPRGWAFCNGQLLQISQNTALFSLIGTTYGGNGWETMALPNLQGRAPMHPGDGAGLTSRRLGQKGGTSQVTLSAAQMPSHNHTFGVTDIPADSHQAGKPAISPLGDKQFQTVTDSNLVDMKTDALQLAGGGQPHNNMPPYLVLNYIIALTGTYPSQS